MLRLLLLLALFPALLIAQTGTTIQPEFTAPPTLEGNAPTADELAPPQVNIIKRGNEIHAEYRVNGELVMIRITPQFGPPYFLVDADGDGNWEPQGHPLSHGFMLPTWQVFRW